MAVPSKPGSWVDPSKKAEHVLDYVLEDTSDEVIEKRAIASPVEQELQKAPLVVVNSSRLKSRVLFLTTDLTVLVQNSLSQLHFLNLASVFDEIHILVLSDGRQTNKGFDRIAERVWVYTTSAKVWWLTPFAAFDVAHSQLTFGEMFRPDIIVALDPFESGLCGLWLAEKYNRAFQLHITEDFFIPEFKKREERNKWRLKIASHVLKRVGSVRASTVALKEKIVKQFKHVSDIAVLPRYYNIQSILDAGEQNETEDAFPQYSFVILFVGKLDHESTLFRALDASRSLLRTKSIVLMVLGDGPFKSEFEKRAEILGIKEQVRFEKDESKLLPFLKSADILIVSDTTEASDELVIKAAAAGTPLLMAETQLRNDLFVDGTSAFLCKKEDTVAFSEKLTKFLNNNALRIQFSQNGRDIVKSRLYEDPQVYKEAYRDSIELVFTREDSEKKDKK